MDPSVCSTFEIPAQTIGLGDFGSHRNTIIVRDTAMHAETQSTYVITANGEQHVPRSVTPMVMAILRIHHGRLAGVGQQLSRSPWTVALRHFMRCPTMRASSSTFLAFLKKFAG